MPSSNTPPAERTPSDERVPPDERAPPDERTPSGTEPGATVVEWGPIRYRRLRSLVGGAFLVAAGGFAVLLALAAASLVVGGGTGGGTALLVATLLLVGGPFSLLYLLVAYDATDPDRRSSLAEELGLGLVGGSALSLPWLVAGGVLGGAGTWLLSTSLSDVFAFAPLLVVPGLLALTHEGSRYRLDAEAGTIRKEWSGRTHESSLDALAGVRRLDVGGVALIQPVNRGASGLTDPSLLVVPVAKADAVEAGLRRVLRREGPPERAGIVKRVVVGWIGLSFLTLGPGIYHSTGEPGAVLLTAGTAPVGLLLAYFAFRI